MRAARMGIVDRWRRKGRCAECGRLHSKGVPTAILSVIALAFAGCATVPPPTNEHLDSNVGNFVLVAKEKTGWKGIRGDETSRLIYAKQGETPENWTVKLEVTDLPIAITFLSSTVRWNPESI